MRFFSVKLEKTAVTRFESGTTNPGSSWRPEYSLKPLLLIVLQTPAFIVSFCFRVFFRVPRLPALICVQECKQEKCIPLYWILGKSLTLMCCSMMQSDSEILNESRNAVSVSNVSTGEEIVLQIKELKLSAVMFHIPSRRIRVSSEGRTRRQYSATKLC
jgi:hypothetical protein